MAKYAADRYCVRVVDKVAWDDNVQGPLSAECIVADLRDAAACRKACEDIHIVVHLAADADPKADFDGSLLANNIVATHNMFRAAKDAGCKRFIFASSAHVVSAYAADVQVNSRMPVTPGNVYGATKCFGEALAAYFAYAEGLPSIVLRIGAYTFPEEYGHFRLEEMDAFLDLDDFNQLSIECLETPNIKFAIAHAISNNRYKRLDLRETRETLSYRPEADAFEIFKVGAGLPLPHQQAGQPNEYPTALRDRSSTMRKVIALEFVTLEGSSKPAAGRRKIPAGALRTAGG